MSFIPFDDVGYWYFFGIQSSDRRSLLPKGEGNLDFH